MHVIMSMHLLAGALPTCEPVRVCCKLCELFSRKQASLQGVILGLHVRRGHKYIEIPAGPSEALFPPIASLMSTIFRITLPQTAAEAASLVAAKRGFSDTRPWATAFVASEDRGAVEEVSTALAVPCFQSFSPCRT